MGAGALLAGLVLGAIGSGVSYASSLSGMRQQRRAARDAENLASKNAAELRRRGAEEAELRRAEGRRLSARQRVAASASGFQMDQFFDLLVDTATREESAAQRVQRGYDAEASLELTRGALTARGLRKQARATAIGGTADFLGGLGSAAVSYGTYSKLY
jgi:hypothetical protein